VPHPNLSAGSGPASRATATPPPPPRFGASEDADVRDRSTADASTSERAVAAALEPVAWDAYFDEKLDVRGESDADVFRVYARRGGERVGRRSDRLHDATATETDASRSAAGEKRTETVVLFAHGCAYTALSWATTIANLATRLDSSVVLAAFDARHHGATRVSPREKINDGVDDETSGDDVDVSAERLARDVASVARAVVGHFARSQTGTKENGSMGSEERNRNRPPKLVLVGHSMGGAAVARAAATIGDDTNSATRDFDLRGVVVVDVVEGSAMAALRDAEFSLARRPSSFATPADAVAWFVRSGLTTNLESARVSAPSQIRSSNDRWVWIADARRTAPHWRGWFEGLSRLFLSLKCAKLLIVADTDRLDTELTIAQMQGKFQTVLVPNATHAVHEDQPSVAADAVAGFVARYAR
jgi:protein phosphatase methylesterase 1